MSDVEKVVKEFYDSYGWTDKEDEKSGETELFRQFSQAYYPYHDGVNARTEKLFDDVSGDLLMAGGGDLPETHLTIARKFDSTTFLDISERALDIARKKYPGADYVNGSILEIPRPDDSFDAVYCAHVIYHIDKDLQEQAIRELIRVTKPGGKVVVLYRNPRSVGDRVEGSRWIARGLRKLRRAIKRSGDLQPKSRPPLYFHSHPLLWWERYEADCDIEMIPWDPFSSTQDRLFLPVEWFARAVYGFCGWLERKHPDTAVRWFSYPAVVLTPKARSTS